jgi:transposase InsO family protein
VASRRARARSALTTARRSPPAPSRRSWPRSGSRTAAAATATPESQAFIESWFGKLKQRCVWRHEFETLDEAWEVIGAYVTHYHHRPQSRLDYRTPLEVAAT